MNQAIMTGCVSAEWNGPTILPVDGYENYFIDVQGNVFTKRKNGFRMRSPSDNGLGYKQIFLFKENKHKSPLVHRLVWETFVGPVPKGLQIDHINLNKNDNSLRNLRLVTPAQNRANNKSKNYGFCKTKNRWYVSFFKNGKTVFHKTFKTEEEAKCVAEIMRPAIKGDFARIVSV